jgi:prepilin-type N-terminal cleavage/methylation domain-containing protein
MKAGFTLVELSIVLVIIGLVIGGVLVGQDLISAASVLAQISQIEKYQTAVNTFKLKFNALPGDIADPNASAFGFAARGQYAGEGDGDGFIQGINDSSGGQDIWGVFTGESGMFWVDLSQAQLIDDNFSSATPTAVPATGSILPTQVRLYLPTAKIGRGNNIGIIGGQSDSIGVGINYFTLAAVTTNFWFGRPDSIPSLTVQEAYNIDKKMDDGLPQSGAVTAHYDASLGTNNWAAAYGYSGAADISGGPTTNATPPSATNCYDNNNVTGPQQYSMKNANQINCALSFQFQ